MDVFLIKDGVVVNIAAVDSLAQAATLYPDMQVVERTDDNRQTQIGDAAP